MANDGNSTFPYEYSRLFIYVNNFVKRNHSFHYKGLVFVFFELVICTSFEALKINCAVAEEILENLTILSCESDIKIKTYSEDFAREKVYS